MKRRPPRKSAAGANAKRAVDGSFAGNEKLSQDEDAVRHTERARELVLAEWTAIVRGLIKKAKSGGYQQTKLLLELCEITGTDASQLNEQRKRQLCDALLEGFGLPSEQADDEVAKVEPIQEPENTEAL